MEKRKYWEEESRALSRRIYYLEFGLLIVSLALTVYFSFNLFADSGFFKRTLILLFGLGGISSFHFLFQRLWDLWADLHDRLESSKVVDTQIVSEAVEPVIKSTIKVLLSSENEEFLNKHTSFLENKIAKLSKGTCEVVVMKTKVETISYVTDHVVHVVILDSHYQTESCTVLAEQIKAVDKNIPVVVCSPNTQTPSDSIDAWFSYLQREADVEKLLPYFLVTETKRGTSLAKS